METIKKLCDIDPSDLPPLEHVFGRSLSALRDAEVVLRIPASSGTIPLESDSDELPEWCNVLEGLTQHDLDEFTATLDLPVQLTHR